MMYLNNKYDIGYVLEVIYEGDVMLGMVTSIVCYGGGAICYRLLINYCNPIEVSEDDVIAGYFKLNKEL